MDEKVMVTMQSPDGQETREVDIHGDELIPLMTKGWKQKAESAKPPELPLKIKPEVA